LNATGWQTEQPAEWVPEDFLNELPERATVTIEGRLVYLRAWRYDLKGATGGNRASGLNLAVAAIVAWKTVYPERAVASLSAPGKEIGTDLLAHLSPLGWEHINVTGDYVWHSKKHFTQGRFRPLRAPHNKASGLSR
jgi:hypothetical protein